MEIQANLTPANLATSTDLDIALQSNLLSRVKVIEYLRSANPHKNARVNCLIGSANFTFGHLNSV